jgi:outer membrane lipoprotein SlyB
MRIYTSAILLASIVPCFAFAQSESLSSLERGARIRVTALALSETERIGRLESISADSIRFRPDAHPASRSVSLGSVHAVEVSRGTRTRRSEYTGVGVLIGGVIGYISSNHGGQGIGTGNADASQNAVTGAIAGVAIGGALGWWLGGKKKVEDWRPVDR